MKSGKIIYEPKGRAGEYAPLAVNLYRGCMHQCKYCYVPSVLHIKPEDFHGTVQPRNGILAKLGAEAKQMAGDPREVLLCFTCDPYQPIPSTLDITRQAIELLGKNDMRFTVLTKGGMRAARDFDLLKKYGGRFGTTLAFFDGIKAMEWEPNAVTVADRIDAIMAAWRMGIKTWVSLEPVIEPEEVYRLIAEIHPFVDAWKVGRWNYDERSDKIDWREFLLRVKAILDGVGAEYYVKKSLAAFGE